MDLHRQLVVSLVPSTNSEIQHCECEEFRTTEFGTCDGNVKISRTRKVRLRDILVESVSMAEIVVVVAAAVRFVAVD